MLVNTIEDLIKQIYESEKSKKNLSPKDRSVLFSIAAQFSKSLTLTINQANLVLTILEENREKIEMISKNQSLLKSPVFKYPFRVIDTSKKIFIKNNTHIGIKFPFNQVIKQFLLKEMKGHLEFDFDSKTYFYPLTDENVLKLLNSKEISDETFDISQDLRDLYNHLQNIIENADNYLPTIDYDNGVFLKNSNKLVTNYFDKHRTDNILSNVFLAKTLGIQPSKKLIDMINSMEFNPKFVDLLINEKNKIRSSDTVKKDIEFLTSFVSTINQWPIMIIMSNDATADTELNNWVSALLEHGISNEEISVLFRSQTNKDCNTFIKDSKLNNLVDEKTKAIFIKNKIPKVLYKINFQPKIVISTSKFYAHYTSQKLVASHPYTIIYSDQIETGLQIGEL
jgi:hypothetical protein